jgi:hypothetical protein
MTRAPSILANLDAATAQRAGGAHDQHPFPGLEIGLTHQKIKRHGKMTRDHGSLGERDCVGQLHGVPCGQSDEFRIAAPAVHADALAVNTTALLAAEAGPALTTGDRRDDRDTVADRKLGDAGANGHDFPGRIGTEHVGQRDLHRILAGANDQIQGAVNRNRMNSDQNLAARGSGFRNFFQAQNLGSAKFFQKDRFQFKVVILLD